MHRRTLALVAALGLAAVGCRAARIERARGEHRAQMLDRTARLSVVLWGSPRSPSGVIEDRRRFDCTWDRLAHAGRDPRPDFGCMVRQFDALLACPRGDAWLDCSRRSRAVCTPSAEFTRAGEQCHVRGTY